MWRTLGRDGRWQGELWNWRQNGEGFLERLNIVAIAGIVGVVGPMGGGSMQGGSVSRSRSQPCGFFGSTAHMAHGTEIVPCCSTSTFSGVFIAWSSRLG